jgi:hypothetical protein
MDLPPEWRGLNDIPDSVELLRFYQGDKKPCEYALSFGNESKLVKIFAVKEHHSGHAFLRVSNRALKIFRSGLEFAKRFTT